MADAVQTTVTVNAAPGAPGREYDLGPKDIITKIALEAIPFGCWVNISGENCELPDAAAEVTGAPGGIALVDESKPSGAGYAIGDPVRVMRKGRAWVRSENAVTAGAAAFVRHTGAGQQQGAFRSDADGTNAATPPATVYYLALDGMAVVEVNQP